jgi:hypothetical protein
MRDINSHQAIDQQQFPKDQLLMCHHSFLFFHYAFQLGQQLLPDMGKELQLIVRGGHKFIILLRHK